MSNAELRELVEAYGKECVCAQYEPGRYATQAMNRAMARILRLNVAHVQLLPGEDPETNCECYECESIRAELAQEALNAS